MTNHLNFYRVKTQSIHWLQLYSSAVFKRLNHRTLSICDFLTLGRPKQGIHNQFSNAVVSTALKTTRIIRVGYSSARPDKHYGETCQQGVIHSGLRQTFNSNLEGAFRTYGRHDSAKAYFFIKERRKTSGSVELSTQVHNCKWQLTFTESMMTGHCSKPQAHMSLSAHWQS